MCVELKRLMRLLRNYVRNMTEVVPAIIPHSFSDIEQQMALVRGAVDFVQIDVMDGAFAPEPSWPYVGDHGEFNDLVSETEAMPFWKELNFEVDLMVRQPRDVIENWISLGATRIIIHLESEGDMDEIINLIRERSGSVGSPLYTEVGIALVPSTSLDELKPYLDKIDFVQFMGNDQIGFHGVELDETVYDKIKELREVFDKPIAVDIGVNRDTAPRLVEAGCTKLVSGSAIFNSGEAKEVIKEFKNL